MIAIRLSAVAKKERAIGEPSKGRRQSGQKSPKRDGKKKRPHPIVVIIIGLFILLLLQGYITVIITYEGRKYPKLDPRFSPNCRRRCVYVMFSGLLFMFRNDRKSFTGRSAGRPSSITREQIFIEINVRM